MVPRTDARDLSILFIAHLVNRGNINPIMEIMHSICNKDTSTEICKTVQSYPPILL